MNKGNSSINDAIAAVDAEILLSEAAFDEAKARLTGLTKRCAELGSMRDLTANELSRSQTESTVEDVVRLMTRRAALDRIIDDADRDFRAAERAMETAGTILADARRRRDLIRLRTQRT